MRMRTIQAAAAVFAAAALLGWPAEGEWPGVANS